MTREDYDQKRRECWEEFRTHVVCGTDNPKGWFERAFDRAYALGKQETKQETKQEIIISGWVCRDKVCNKPFTSDLFLVLEKPTRVVEWGKWCDCGDYIELDSNLFPDLTWDDDPIKVKIIIKKKKK